MKIVLIGAGGQLAHDLKLTLAAEHVVSLTRAELDIADADRVRAVLNEIRPEIIINAAAYNLVDQAETEPAAAFAVNAFGPLHLARWCGEHNTTLVHFSTDYVFGLDSHKTPWNETDLPGPASVYGISKLSGENAVRAYCPRHLILRTCGLYGEKGSRGKGGNFVETMLRLAAAGKPIRVVHDQVCTPSSTKDVATTTAALLRADVFGMFHVTNTGSCSWFEFAREIFRLAGVAADCQPITAAQFGAAAKRPAYSVLSTRKLIEHDIFPPPAWQDALQSYLQERAKR